MKPVYALLLISFAAVDLMAQGTGPSRAQKEKQASASATVSQKDRPGVSKEQPKPKQQPATQPKKGAAFKPASKESPKKKK